MFFALCAACLFFVPKKAKNATLFAFSLLFYAWGKPVYVGLMIFSTVLDYCCGRAVEKYRGTPKAKIGLLVSVIVNLNLLCLFKYTDFFHRHGKRHFRMQYSSFEFALAYRHFILHFSNHELHY